MTTVLNSPPLPVGDAVDRVFATGPSCIKRWKNGGLVYQALIAMKDRKIERFTAAQVEAVLIGAGLSANWRRNPGAQDKYGLRRGVGDLLGGHLFMLRHEGTGKRKVYLMPSVLPQMDLNDPDARITDAIY